MQFKPLIQNVILIIILLILGYTAFILQKDNTPILQTESPFPLFTIKEYDLHRFDKDGNLIYDISGPAMSHFDNSKGTILSSPILSHYEIENKGIVDWTVQSDQAIISQDQNLITLDGNVILTSFDAKTRDPTILKSSQLFVHDKGEKVTNDQFTKIYTYPNNTIEGIGVLGFPNIGKFNLLKDIKSYYETQPTH